MSDVEKPSITIPPKSYEWLQFLQAGPASATGRGRSGYWCRSHHFTEWLWTHTDGREAASSELSNLFGGGSNWFVQAQREGWSLDALNRECLTKAGREVIQ